MAGKPKIEVANPLLVSSDEMRAIEAAEAERGNTSEVLMERAGKQVASHTVEWLNARGVPHVLALAGPGNNGGDALVVARILAEKGWQVRCLTWVRDAARDGRLQAPLRERNVPVEPLTLSALPVALEWATVVIDGLLGTGIKRDVEGELAEVVRQVAEAGRTCVAVDIPTGVDSDTGAVRGVALPCGLTVALGLLKYGHVQQPGARLSGNIVLGDIGLSDQTSRDRASGELMTDDSIRAILPERPDDANKGTFGKAMVVAGSVNYIGAAALATQGAMRAGAGLVTLACAGDLLILLAPKLTECTFLPLPSDMGAINARAIDKLKDALKGYTALLVGCGLGKEKETGQFLRSLLSHVEDEKEHRIGFASRKVDAPAPKEQEKTGLPPLILDGDALNLLSEMDNWPDLVPEGCVLTPHPGEMARLLKSSVEEVQGDRINVARSAAGDWKQIVVLKGAGTVIAEPGGKVYVSPFSNPALASAGTGDVLAGGIAGLLAQGLSPIDAARAGVYLHGMAGELLSEEYGVSGGLAGDLPPLLARAGRRLRG
jgi:NAD(P)H-hydrate epimerase